MIKFLLNILTILLCGFIIFMGGSKAVSNSIPVFSNMMAEIQTVLQETPVIPDSGDNGGSSGNVPGGDTEGDTGDGDESGDSVIDPENPSDKPSDNPTDDSGTTTNTTADAIKGMIDNYNDVVAGTTQNMVSNAITNMIPESNENKDVITDALDTYFDNLYTAIEEKKTETDNMEDSEAAEQIKTEFAEKESAALNGVMNIVGAAGSSEVDEEKMTESVDAILDSTVCLETITTTITEDEKMKEDVKNATANMDETTKATIESSIQQKLEENPQNEEQYQKLAELFGITLNGFKVPVE